MFTLQPRYQMALAFSGGLAAGLLLFALLTSTSKLTSPDPANLYGTLALRDFSEKLPVADQLEFTLEQIQGTVLLKSSGNMLVIEMDIHTQAGIEINLAFQEPGISFRGFTGLNEIQEATLTIEKQGLRFDPKTATNIIFLFRKTTTQSSSFKISIIESGNVLHEKKIAIPGTLD